MKRQFMAVGTSVVLLTLGGSAALANGSHSATVANSANQSASSTQLLPISLGAGVALPINANLPLGLLSAAPVQGSVSQSAGAEARGTASNNRTVQTVRQDGVGNGAGQSASGTQLLPVGGGAGAGAPANANAPAAVSAGGPGQGEVRQGARAESSGSATNAGTSQSVRQEGGGNSATQSASSTQLLPIALGASVAAPVNANVPVGLLSAGPRQGDVRQEAAARAGAAALNNALGQSVEQRGDRSGRNAATQSASSTQLLPIALGASVAAPVNANVPVGLLSAGPRQGNISQRADADAFAEALNNETEQALRQEGRDGARNAATQSASSTQLLPIALGAALGIPVNANIPVALLSAGPLQGDVDQHADAGARARAANLEHEQAVSQRAGRDGSNSASQSASSTQLLPIALGAALAIPVNANVPISILSHGPVQGAVNQRADANADAQALNNETEQSVRQQTAGGQNAASQSASNTQMLPIALGPAIALPVNLNIPIAILSHGPIQGPVSQQGRATANGEALNNELDQSVEQASERDGRNSANQGASNTQILPVALGAGVSAPLNVDLPIAILSNGQLVGIGGLDVLETVTGTLADPFGAAGGVLGNPLGAVTGLLGGL